ncbi:uncharacterized protein LOC107267623 isoform X2 [Cephus cinctus]|uniref:Uncharacterized protein LOC107267623 isoform X2 n=1 Tax=Cephus cinctus TaxID=211228 RepID=A0AAJ7BUY3_CEPCN|nr:uncharacterized protein LOC107267623 isoform X2 [Cephus cinctus]
MKEKVTLVPPDGGWGWFVVIGYALSNIVTIPIMQGFGLLYKDTFDSKGISATEAATIININSAFGMIFGLVNGVFLQIYGYRKLAIAGSLTYSLGIILTFFASSFTGFIVTYGVMASLGTGFLMSSFSLALNTYFRQKRNRAAGISMTITGLGPIVMPQVITLLLGIYGASGAVLILGGFCLHSLVGALLLQPVKWHAKKAVEPSTPQELIPPEDQDKYFEDEMTQEQTENENISGSAEVIGVRRKRTLTMSSIDHDVETASIYGFETPLPRKKSTSVMPHMTVPRSDSDIETESPCSSSLLTYRRSISQPNKQPATPTDICETSSPSVFTYHWWNSEKSLDTIYLGSSIKIFDDTSSRILGKGNSRSDLQKEKSFSLKKNNSVSVLGEKKSLVEPLEEADEEEEEQLDKKEKKILVHEKEEDPKKNEQGSIFRQLINRIVIICDMDLLRDPIYVNLMFGMSIAIFAEINFSQLTPLILRDFQFSDVQISAVMSTIASVDLVFRGVSPFMAEWLNKSSRTMYLFSLVLLVIARTTLILTSSFSSVIMVAIGLGVAKGIRSVNMILVIPSYVPFEKLASASGIQMVVNGIFLLCAGPFLGVIRDRTGSYIICIIVLNCLTLLTITMWITELSIVNRLKRRKRNEIQRKESTKN